MSDNVVLELLRAIRTGTGETKADVIEIRSASDRWKRSTPRSPAGSIASAEM